MTNLRDRYRTGAGEIDLSTFAAKTIEYEHAEIHSGDHYECEFYDATMANTETISLGWKTPDSDKLMHLVPAWWFKLECSIILYENATWTAETGTQCPIINSHRDFQKKESTLLENQSSAAFLVTDNMVANATGVDVSGATAIRSVRQGASNKIGSTFRAAEEQVLKRNTQYLILLTAHVNSNGGGIYLAWYEHSDRKIA